MSEAMKSFENGQLETILPDTPMGRTALVYQDIPYHWCLAKQSETDCVAEALAEALGEDLEVMKGRLEAAADLLGQDPKLGFTRAAIKEVFEDTRTGRALRFAGKIFKAARWWTRPPARTRGPS